MGNWPGLFVVIQKPDETKSASKCTNYSFSKCQKYLKQFNNVQFIVAIKCNGYGFI